MAEHNQKIEDLEREVKELKERNDHLLAATFRERSLKKELKKTVDALEESKQIIQDKNRRIQESINYAKSIQNAIIPNEKEVEKHFGDYSLFYKPKDVVSGDFPYFKQQGDDLFLAAIDCTGHGVPGAMMSLISHLLLTSVIKENPNEKLGDLLAILHERVTSMLQKKSAEKSRDGMDVAICKINTKTKVLEYAGAHRPLFAILDGEFQEFKGDRKSIGGSNHNRKFDFVTHEIVFKENDKLIMFSDGFQDQFNCEDKKYGIKTMRNRFMNEKESSITTIIQNYKESFQEWTGECTQIDDVLLMGVQF